MMKYLAFLHMQELFAMHGILLIKRASERASQLSE